MQRSRGSYLYYLVNYDFLNCLPKGLKAVKLYKKFYIFIAIKSINLEIQNSKFMLWESSDILLSKTNQHGRCFDVVDISV